METDYYWCAGGSKLAMLDVIEVGPLVGGASIWSEIGLVMIDGEAGWRDSALFRKGLDGVLFPAPNS